MRRASSAVLLATLAIAVAACGGGDDTDDTAPAPTTTPRPTGDARLDPDDIVITDGDGGTVTVPVTPDAEADDGDAADPTTDTTDPDEPAGPADGEADTAGADADGAGSDADPAGGSGPDPTTGPDDPAFTRGEEIPADWPDDVPAPDGLTEIAATVFEDAVEYTIVVTGNPSDDPAAYVAGYLAAARGAGFETSSVIEDERQVYSFVAERDGWFLSAASTAVGGVDEIVVALTRNL